MSVVSVDVITDVPISASSKGSKVGSNPKVYNRIKEKLIGRGRDAKNIEEVHLALYLFNNEDLYYTLKSLADSARVIVTTIPLAGYDKRKAEAAGKIYQSVIESKSPNFELLIYPHMYVWHEAKYAEMGVGYSLHVKAGYARYRDGSCKLMLTSCNMSPGDPFHSETAVIVEDSQCSSAYSRAFRMFFDQLERLAVPWREYYSSVSKLEKELQGVFDFAYIGKCGLNDWGGNFVDAAFFTGPFITINGVGSTWYAREKIVSLVMSAKRRVLVVAQHVHDIAPFNNYSDNTLVGALVDKKMREPDIEVKVLKQVTSRGLADKRRAAFVECHLSNAGVEQKANRLVHDKFIVVDDIAIVSTGNFTATQFAWGEINMELRVSGDAKVLSELIGKAFEIYGRFHGGAYATVKVEPVRARKAASSGVKVIKRDIFAEVNGFIIINDKNAVAHLVDHFNSLWRHKLSETVRVPK